MKKFLASTTLLILTTMNTLGVSLTYFDSVINFLRHTGLRDHSLTELEEEWEIYVVALTALACIFIAWNNQRVMPDHIVRLLNKITYKLFGTKLFIVPEFTHSRTGVIVDTVGCIAKATISSLSLSSSVYDYTKDMTDDNLKNWSIPIVVSALSLLGNLLAVFSVIMEHRRDANGKPWSCNRTLPVAKAWAKFVGVSYGFAQAGIYSNALTNPFVIAGVLKNRPGFNSKDFAGIAFFWGSFYPCVEFGYGSGASMYNRTLKVLGHRDQKEYLFYSPPRSTRWQKWRGAVASGFRSLAFTAAIFCFFYLMTKGDLLITAIPTGFSILAAFGVVSLLFPLEEGEETHFNPMAGNLNSFFMGNQPLLINGDNPIQTHEQHDLPAYGHF